jgi:hypothetical protein
MLPHMVGVLSQGTFLHGQGDGPDDVARGAVGEQGKIRWREGHSRQDGRGSGELR